MKFKKENFENESISDIFDYIIQVSKFCVQNSMFAEITNHENIKRRILRDFVEIGECIKSLSDEKESEYTEKLKQRNQELTDLVRTMSSKLNKRKLNSQETMCNPFTPWTNCCNSVVYSDGFNPQANWCKSLE